MPTNGSCLNLITSGSNIPKVTSIAPSKAKFLLFLYDTLAGLRPIRSSHFTSVCLLEKQYLPFLKAGRRLSNGYYVLKFKNMHCWFQQSTQIRMVGLIVLMGSSGLPNRLIHQQNAKWFGSHKSMSQLFWTATPILPEAPRSCRTGWMQNDVPVRYSESPFRFSSTLLT